MDGMTINHIVSIDHGSYDNYDRHGMEWGSTFSEKTNRWRGVQTLGSHPHV